MTTGDAVTSGEIRIATGASVSGASGNIEFISGDSTVGDAGSSTIQAGSGNIGGSVSILAGQSVSKNGGAIDILAASQGNLNLQTSAGSVCCLRRLRFDFFCLSLSSPGSLECHDTTNATADMNACAVS